VAVVDVVDQLICSARPVAQRVETPI